MSVRHSSYAQLEAELPEIERSPRERGTLSLIVRRPRAGERETLDTATLDVEEGLVGDRWALGKRRGYLTPAQFFRERWGSDGLGLLLFVAQLGLLIPYLLIGVMGGGITLTQVTKGQVPDWVGGLVICAVVLAYVTYGGMRGTIWVNLFQTGVLINPIVQAG